jgi:hypothetical protein
MSNPLPPAGTHRLLELVAPYIPDAFIDEVCPRQFTGGRRCQLSAPQLWRTHLLALLTSTHSLNLVVAQLPEQPAWRRFCRLRRHWPGVRMLHEFRQRIGVSGLRRVNQHLLEGLLRRHGVQPHAVALIDATDLPAACNGFKKKHRHLYSLRRGLGRSHAQDRAEPLVCWLQETYLATLAADASSLGDVVAVGQLAGSGQRERGRFVVAEPALVPATFGMVARDRRSRYGLFVGGEQKGRAGELADGGRHQVAGRHETGAAVCHSPAGRVPTGATAGMVGLRTGNFATVVPGRSSGEPLRPMLGKVALPAAVWLCGRFARNVIWFTAFGQSPGATVIATSQALD